MININAHVSIENIGDSMPDDATALEVIKSIDGYGGDWEFTQKCAKYFVEQIVTGCKGDDVMNDYYEELKEMLK